MITKEDYKNLLEYFHMCEIPENLKNFIEKLEVIYEELLYREEVQEKITDLHKRLEDLSAEKKED